MGINSQKEEKNIEFSCSSHPLPVLDHDTNQMVLIQCMQSKANKNQKKKMSKFFAFNNYCTM